MLLMSLLVWILTDTHEDDELAARVTSSTRPPFSAIDSIKFTTWSLFNLASHVRGIRRCNCWLCHTKHRSNLTIQQWFQPLLLLLGRSVQMKCLHVSSVWRVAVENIGSKEAFTHNFAELGVFQLG